MGKKYFSHWNIAKNETASNLMFLWIMKWKQGINYLKQNFQVLCYALTESLSIKPDRTSKP